MQLEIQRKKIHSLIYFWGLVLVGISLPVSPFLLSVSILGLSLNWILEGGFVRKLKILWHRKSVIAILSIYILQIIGLLYSKDLSYGLQDSKIKLPLLALPLIVGTSEFISLKKIKVILQFFIASVFVGTIISSVAYLLMKQTYLPDTRRISLIISHIRFSLLIDLSVFICLYFSLFKTFQVRNHEKIIYLPAAGWFILFQLILQSFTGIWILMVLLPVVLISWAFNQKKIWVRASVIIFLSGGLSLILAVTYSAYSKFYPPPSINRKSLEKFTAQGNLYSQNTDNNILENGHYVYLNICEKELREEWNRLSNIDYDGTDRKGQSLKQTLIRYLTSKGLYKDSAGLAKLKPEDISMIEDGYSNYIFSRHLGIYPRIYQFFWELDVYLKTGSSGGHSLSQRIEYLKNGMEIIRKNFWYGVGTGDVKLEYDNQYEISDSKLEKELRLRAHNQFVTFFITFGIVGFTWILLAFGYTLWHEKKWQDLPAIAFLLIAFLSMFNEDTLETQAGVSFFAFFFSLFVFGYKKESKY